MFTFILISFYSKHWENDLLSESECLLNLLKVLMKYMYWFWIKVISYKKLWQNSKILYLQAIYVEWNNVFKTFLAISLYS